MHTDAKGSKFHQHGRGGGLDKKAIKHRRRTLEIRCYAVLGALKFRRDEGSAYEGAALMEHEPDSGKGYGSRKGCAEPVAQDGIPVSASRQGVAGSAGHRFEEVQNGHFCAWLLLAPA
jgi:hypothetical protein